MTYDEFLALFKQKAESELSYDPASIEFYPEGYTSEDPNVLEWIIDTNKRFTGEASPWLKKDFMLLKDKGKNEAAVIQRIAIHDVYLDAEKDGFDAAFEAVRKSREEIVRAKIDHDVINKRGAASYDEIREQLIIRPLNYGLHIDELRGRVYRRIGDIALVLYQLIGDAENTLISSKISREEVKLWGINDTDKVIDDALENTARIFPASTYSYTKNQEIDVMSEDFTKQDISLGGTMLMISTFKATNGAAALFYPGVAAKMMKVMGGAFWAVFMNINDVMLFDRGDPMAQSCAEMARDGGGQGEMLSGRIYLCSEKGITPA